MSRSLRWLTIVSTLLAVAALASLAQAQPGQPGGRRGGPGGMMQSPSSMWGMLLRSEKVQKELDLVDDQKNKLKELNEKAMTAMTKAREGMPSREAMRDMSEEDRNKAFADMRKKMEAFGEEQKKAIEDLLLPNQLDRLKQIALQLQGVRALSDKDTQKALGLSDEQVEKLNKVQQDAMEKMRGLFGPNTDRDQVRQKMETLRKESEEKAMAVLTPEQVEKFNKMKGEKFDVSFRDLMPQRGAGAPKQ